MRILVLNRFHLEATPYAAWARGGDELVLITARDALPPHGSVPNASAYAVVEVVEDYLGAETELLAEMHHGQRAFDRVLAMSEFDLLRAARLRERWGVEGQLSPEAVLFRDKLLMKRRLVAEGIPVARFRPVDHPTDLVAAAEELGFPFVVKPRLGAASVGVCVVRNIADLREVATAGMFNGDSPALQLAEEFVSNDLFQVDGLVEAGRTRMCWPSEQRASCLDITRGAVNYSTSLDPEDSRVEAIRELTAAANHALGMPGDALFHAEVFATDRGLVFNEVGARIGGAKVRQQVQIGFGLDPIEWYARAVFGTAPALRLPDRPVLQSGYALVPPREGTVRAVGPVDLPEGVEAYISATVGDRLGPPVASTSSLASFVAAGASQTAVLQALESAVASFESALRLDGEGS